MTDPTVDALAAALDDRFGAVYPEEPDFRDDAIAVAAALVDAGYVVVRAEDVRVARHAIVQASINLANGDTVSAQGDIEWALAALATKEIR